LTHKIACLEKNHGNPKCKEWIQRFSRNVATQVNLAEFSTDVDVGEEITVPPNPIPLSVFSAISSSTQTAFPGVHVGRESNPSVGFDRLILSESLSVGNEAKTMKDCEEGSQLHGAERGDDLHMSTCNRERDPLAPSDHLIILNDNQHKERKNPEQNRSDEKALCRQDIQRVVQQTRPEDEEFDVETMPLDAEDSSYNHPSASPVSVYFAQIVFENLTESLSILEENPEEHLSEETDMLTDQVSSPDPQSSIIAAFERADIQREVESSSDTQEIGEENMFEEFDVPAVRSFSPVSSDRECSLAVMRTSSHDLDTQMVSQDVLATTVPIRTITCNTAKCLNPPSRHNAKCDSCLNGRSSGKQNRQSCLLGRSSVRKRKPKPSKAFVNKKQKPDSHSETPHPEMIGATLQDHASIGNSQAVSLPGGHPISWMELCYTVMLEAPYHSSNFKQLCNLVRNWLYNTFSSIEFDINDENMMQGLQAVVKNSPNFEILEKPGKRKKETPVEVSLREYAIKKVKIVVSCFRAKLARPEYHHNMSTYLLPKSRVRPETSFENLIGMALHALPKKHVEEIEIVTWISETVVGYQTSFSGRNGLGYKYQGDWKQQLREELHASLFFKMRVSEVGNEEWKFRKGCAEYFRKWDG
ncbi:hypothetical protein KCU61_g7253, partial [Aureobasidium melanogenum]